MSFTYWISQPENQVLLFGALLLLIGGWVFLCAAFPRRPDEVTPPSEAPTEVLPAFPVQDSEEVWYPLKREFLGHLDAAADATQEITRYYERVDVTVVREVVIEWADPLDDTVELPIHDDETPLYRSIPAPKRYDGESFTVGWSRERINAIIAAGRPE